MRTNDTHKATNPADEELPSTHADEGPPPARATLQLNDDLLRSLLRELDPISCDLEALHLSFQSWSATRDKLLKELK